MVIKFNTEQIEFLREAGITFDVTSDLTDDQIVDLTEIAGDYLMYIGYDKEYYPNEKGVIGESIMDLLGEL